MFLSLPHFIRTMPALALTALLIAACGPQSQKEGTPERPGAATASDAGKIVMHRGNGAEPDTLDHQKSSGKWETDIISEMIEGLMTVDAKGKPVYGAAESHTLSPDGLVYTFKLRPATWSDGTPVTADDFVAAYRRILDPATAAQYASLIYPLKNARAVNAGERPVTEVGARAVDASTLEITLENPTPFFLELLTHKTMYPIPKHAVEKFGDDWVKAENYVANGPYRLAEWLPNGHVKIVKNEAYHDAANVLIDIVYFYPISDSAIELSRFRAGEIDVTSSLPARQLPWARETFGDLVRVVPYLTTTYIQVNVQKDPFTDIRVREALSLALDRENITDKVLNAGQRPAYALVPPGMNNYTSGAQLRFKSMSMEERKARARQLLAEAGFGPDNPLEFDYRYIEGLDGRRIAVAFEQMWKEIGVTAKLLNTDTKVHYNSLRTQDFELGLAGWVADYNDPENYLFLLQSTSGQMNYSKYENPAFDALMAEAARTIDLGARAKILEQAEQLILDDHPIIPILNGATRRVVASHVKGWEDNIGDWHLTRYLRIERQGS